MEMSIFIGVGSLISLILFQNFIQLLTLSVSVHVRQEYPQGIPLEAIVVNVSGCVQGQVVHVIS